MLMQFKIQLNRQLQWQFPSGTVTGHNLEDLVDISYHGDHWSVYPSATSLHDAVILTYGQETVGGSFPGKKRRRAASQETFAMIASAGP